MTGGIADWESWNMTAQLLTCYLPVAGVIRSAPALEVQGLGTQGRAEEKIELYNAVQG